MMKKAVTTFATLAGLAMAMSGAHAMGMDAASGAYMLMKRLDANGDGVVTMEEAGKAREQRFAAMDANGDGKVTVDEIDAMIDRKLQRRKIRMRYRMLGMLDANGDGVIDKDEMLKAGQRHFMRADLNGDGRLDRRELRIMKKRMSYRMGKAHRLSRKGAMYDGRHGKAYGMHGKGGCAKGGMKKRPMQDMPGGMPQGR
jgi:hypothetical protein